MDDYLRQYGLVLMFAVLAFVVPVSMLLVSWAATAVRIRPHKPNAIKSSIYECGIEVQTPGGQRFHVRYYFFALLFVVFDVETVFIYPWAVHFKMMGLFALLEMAVFILILLIGWAYAWKKHALEWA